jgi:hypothetical protein
MGMNLVTRAEYKTYAGISSTTSDAEIDLLITTASAFVKNYCNTTFIDHYDDPKVESFNGGGFDRFYLKEHPIVAISSVEYSSDYGATYNTLTEYTDWVYDPSVIAIRSLWNTGFTNTINGYRVTYNCGYETTPADLKIAVLDLVSYYRRNDSAIHSTKSISPNTMQIEYVSNTSLPAHIKRVLDIYAVDYT